MENQNNLFLPHSTYLGYCVIAMKKVTNMSRFHTCYGNDIPQRYITTPHIITHRLHVLIFLSLCSCILNGVAKIQQSKQTKALLSVNNNMTANSELFVNKRDDFAHDSGSRSKPGSMELFEGSNQEICS